MAYKTRDLINKLPNKININYDSFFSSSNNSEIKTIEIYAYGLNGTDAKYSSKWEVWKHLNLVLRIITSDGLEGLSGITTNSIKEFDLSHYHELISTCSYVMSKRVNDPIVIRKLLKNKYSNISDSVLTCIDIAYWDLAAKKASLPLYKFLGGQKHSMKAYASLPFYSENKDLIANIELHAQMGFEVFKIHTWGLIEKDLELVNLVEEQFRNKAFQFILDLEGEYNFDQAFRIGKAMNKNTFKWLEAPMKDNLLDDYSRLKRSISIPIIPDGYTHYSEDHIENGLKDDCWSAARFDATIVGGLTKSLELINIINKYSAKLEMQCWGNTLAQALNLHIMLASCKSTYFETPVPIDMYHYGLKNDNLIEDGYTRELKKPGLGIEVDWEKLSDADIYEKTTVK